MSRKSRIRRKIRARVRRAKRNIRRVNRNFSIRM